MMHYQLRCGNEHAFDGWFKDSTGFETQARRGLVACPQCGNAAVARALMAPAVASRRATLGAAVGESGEIPAATPAKLPDAARAALQRVRAEVERRCDYVGPNFANEARRMHRGESARTGIYGEALPDQAEALAEEGIEVACIPWIPRADG